MVIRVAALGLVLGMVGASTATLTAQQKSQAELRNAFIGTWRLVSITGGNNPQARGNPTGLIIYDAHGNMAAQIQPDRQRPTYTGTPTPEQLAERAATRRISALTPSTKRRASSPITGRDSWTAAT